MFAKTLKNPQDATVTVNDNGFTFLDESDGLGVVDLGLAVTIAGVEHVVGYDECQEADGRLNARGHVGTSPLSLRTEITPLEALNAVVVRHTLVNDSNRPVTLSHVETGPFVATAAVRLGKLHMYDGRYVHGDNVRTERFPYFQPEYPYVRQLPVEPVTLGTGEDQPLPALLLTDRRYTLGLLIASTSQEVSLPVWTFHRRPGGLGAGLFASYRMRYELPMAASWTLQPGESLPLDGTLYELQRHTHPQDAFVGYLDWLSERMPFRGPATPLRSTALYCSWNYGRFAEQYEDTLLKTAKFMSENLPNIQYFLMDAGYQLPADVPGFNHAHLSGYYPDPRANVDARKFPQGIRHWSDEVRKLGLRPGIWWSPMVMLNSALAQEHPDWMLRDGQGRVIEVGTCGYLDLTVEPARAFVDEVLSVVLGEWGIDALKMDFWSQGFETRHARLAGANQSAIDTRTILFEIIRKYLPAEGGLFMTCVAVGLGNPFLAVHADTYRNTQDIGAGVWHEQIHACQWALPTVLLEGRKTFLLNTDGLGINPKVPDNENYFRLAWGYITMGMLEIDGFLEDLPVRWVKALRKLSDRCDQGYRVRCPDENAFTGIPLPECLYVDFTAESPTRKGGVKQAVALFNWTDEPKVISIRREKLGHDGGAVTLVDFWTEEEAVLEGEFLTRTLPPRSSLLYDVR